MGHQHLLGIPRSKAWRAVVGLIADGSDVATIAAAASNAAEASMIDAANDDVVRQSFFLLAQTTQAARNRDLGSGLRRIGLQVSNEPTLIEIGAAMMEAIDAYALRRKARTDYGELAQLSAVESLQMVVGREASDMFDPGAVRVHAELRRIAEPRNFAVLARDFFARLTRRHLNFYLSRELAAHVGAGRRFPKLVDQENFELALDLHCREASRIIKEFARDWYFKHTSQGDLDRDLAGRFVHIATGKIRDELQERRQAHA